MPWCSGRHHEPQWVMIMYYPQATSEDMGPTQVESYPSYHPAPLFCSAPLSLRPAFTVTAGISVLPW